MSEVSPEADEPEVHLAGARQGNADARAGLLRALQDPIYRFCLSQLADVDSAHDATQETALQILRGLEGFRGDSRIKTWALGIALNVCRQARRQSLRHRGLGDIQRNEQLSTDAAGPSEVAVRREHDQALQDCLQQLPDRQREVVVLRYFEEMKIDEIAQAMNIAPGTVKATLWQALRRLRKQFENDDATMAKVN